MTGINTLYQLRNSNLKTVLVEQNKIGMGVTSNTTGKITYLQDSIYEKIETILSRLKKSSRLKDFYDIYLIHEHEYHKINKTRLRKAAKQTLKKREFNSDLLECLKIVRKSKILKTRWNSYSKKNKYAKDIEYSKTIECLEDFVKNVNIIQLWRW